MMRTRWFLYALVTSAAVVLDLLMMRIPSVSIPSAGLEFLRYGLTYLYVFAATSVVFVMIGSRNWRTEVSWTRLAMKS
jgi:hypothetical protein